MSDHQTNLQKLKEQQFWCKVYFYANFTSNQGIFTYTSNVYCPGRIKTGDHQTQRQICRSSKSFGAKYIFCGMCTMCAEHADSPKLTMLPMLK